jgi:exopolysaccharide production protein ExoZ
MPTPVNPPPGAARAGAKFGLLELGRGAAAALVVFHHANDVLAEPRFFGAEGFGGHLRNFNVGVDFFFVLSGFIIAWVHWRDIGDRRRLGLYVARRFARIYPPYWCVLLPLIALYQMFPGTGAQSQHDVATALLSIPLLPNVNPPVLGVAWTLTYEVFFYALFAVVIAFGRRAIWIFPAWGVSILVAQCGGDLGFPANFVFNSFNLEFLLGLAGAYWLRNHRPVAPQLILTLGLAAFTAALVVGAHVQDTPIIGRAMFGLSALVALLGAAEFERSRAFRLHPALALFGAASYATYLVHPEAISILARIVSRLAPREAPIEAVVVFVSLVAILAGVIFHRLIEAPLTSWTRRRLSARLARGEPAVRLGV